MFAVLGTLKIITKFINCMRKLIPLCICWAYASGTNAYARCKHQQLMRALVLHKSFKTLWHGLYFSLPDAVPWKASEALSEYSAADEKEMQGKKIGNLRMFLLNFCKMRRRSNFRISPSRLFPNYTSFAQANYITYVGCKTNFNKIHGLYKHSHGL